jgi:hypothetical protein
VSQRIIYGVSISGIKEIIANNWILNLVRGIIIFLLGVFVEKYIF